MCGETIKKRKVEVVMAFFCSIGKKCRNVNPLLEMECKRLLDFISADVEWVQGKMEQCNSSKNTLTLPWQRLHRAHIGILVMHWKQLNCNNASNDQVEQVFSRTTREIDQVAHVPLYGMPCESKYFHSFLHPKKRYFLHSFHWQRK